MKQIFEYNFLGLPILIWVLQLIYVAVALGVYVILLATLFKDAAPQAAIQIAFVLIILIINVIWRIALQRMMSGWS